MPILTIHVPDDAWEGEQGQLEKLSQEIRLATAVYRVKQGRMSKEKASEFAGVGEAQLAEALRAVSRPDVIIEQVVESLSRPSEFTEGRHDFDRQAESHYRAMGRWKGPLAAPEVQRAAQQFWQAEPERSACWLARRLRNESHGDTLYSAADLLASLGMSALASISDELARHPSPDQALACSRRWGGRPGAQAPRTLTKAAWSES